MSRLVKSGAPSRLPPGRGGLTDARSTGGPASAPHRPILTDRRSTRQRRRGPGST
jgi:hypothetical protein